MAAALVPAACGQEDPPSRLTVATTTQVADMARNVAGERMEVRALLRPGADPHDYEPRPADARALTDARLVLRSGGDVDEWLGDLLDSAGGDADVVTLRDSVPRRGEDPHWWHDPRAAQGAVRAIAADLARADPQGAAGYRSRARAYLARLERLDRAVRSCIQRVPPERRKLVTTHDALGYYARRYGIDVVGALIPSLSTQAQPSAGDTAKLVRQLKEEGVEAIFPESSLDPRLERAVAREAGVRVGEELWADALGPKGSSGETYVDSIASNTAALVEGMSGGRVSCRPGA